MATKILVSRRRTGKAEEWTEVDVNETTLMFFDVFLASINSTWATTCESDGENDEECDHFEYYDEDGDAIVVRTDDEFELFMSALQEFAADGQVMRIRLKSSRQPSKKMNDDNQVVDIGQQRPEDLHLLERLSEGQFGTVYKALDVRNDMFMAVKSIALDGAMNSRASILNEVEILKIACESEYVVNFYSAMFVDNELLICLELMDALSLDRYGRLPNPVLGGVTVAVVSGLSYLWSKNIIHRDIKPSNFLVNRKGDVKLSDFGVSKQMAQSVAWSYVGTKVYMAPERITGDLYKIHSDIWSLGISLLEMALGRFPFKEANLQHKLIDEKILQTIVSSEEVLVVGNSFEKLVEGCLKASPFDRMRPECLKISPFICAHTPIDHGAIAKFVNDKLNAREIQCNAEI